MNILIGFSVIFIAIFLFFKNKPSGPHIKKMFFTEILFGVFMMFSSMKFETFLDVCLSFGSIFFIFLMTFCYYKEVKTAKSPSKAHKKLSFKRSKTSFEDNIGKANSVA